MNRIVVHVHHDPNSLTGPLTLSLPTVPITDGQWIEWDFGTLPTGQVGFIRFNNWPAPGPFQRLRFFSTSLVLAYGNVGPKLNNVYTYEALVLSPTGIVGMPCTGTVENLAGEDTSPLASVTIAPNPNPQSTVDQYLVTVHPPNLSLTHGDTATWQVMGLPQNHFISMQFGGTFTESDPLGGPFRSYAVGDLDGFTRLFANAFNFQDNVPIGGQVQYFIKVRDQNGTVVGSDDPMIDNLGPPVPVPEG